MQSVAWLAWCAALCAALCAAHAEGGSLRGALEALQRRQRSSAPLSPLRLPHQPDETPILLDDEDNQYEEFPQGKYVVEYVGGDAKEERRRLHSASAFRERGGHRPDERLQQLFLDQQHLDEERGTNEMDSDEEYAEFLQALWDKYRQAQHEFVESPTDEIVRLYKSRNMHKRQIPGEFFPRAWGPVAFKKKRTALPVTEDDDIDDDNLYRLRYLTQNDRDDDVVQDYGKVEEDEAEPQFSFSDAPALSPPDVKDEYAIAFHPLDGDNIDDLNNNGEIYVYRESKEKRFPVTKRSGKLAQFKRSATNFKLREGKSRSNDKLSRKGTDPKVLRDLSHIFGKSNVDESFIRKPAKRSDNNEDTSHESKSPQVTALSHNTSHHDHNVSHDHEDHSHETHNHGHHHPTLGGKEIEAEDSRDANKAITVQKKSINWSDYFGIDKRRKKSTTFNNKPTDEMLYRHYVNNFRDKVEVPLKQFHLTDKKKRGYHAGPLEENEFEMDTASVSIANPSIHVKRNDKTKLDNIDTKLKDMETAIVDEALHYTEDAENLDAQREQEIKEKMLSRMAAAYSLEKMRKALKEFKINLQTQRNLLKSQPLQDAVQDDATMEKHVAIKKERTDTNHEHGDNEIKISNRLTNNDLTDFETEQGAGHYLNGGIDEHFSEGYMGGSGRHLGPNTIRGKERGSCPVLERIVHRCSSIDLLMGDQGEVFLPLCSLHQICYLCGETSATACDLTFLSAADSACGGARACQQAARGALEALRELHDARADELDGECEASPCLAAALHADQRWRRHR